MRKILIILVTMSIFFGSTAFENGTLEDEGVQFFKGTWDEALAQAKEENKLVFVDIYASWCGPCKAMKAKTFPDPKVGEFYNSRFINVSIDAQSPEGRLIARKYEVVAVPTLLIIDFKGNVLSVSSGFKNPNQLIDFGSLE